MKKFILFLTLIIFFIESIDLVFSACTRSIPCCCENKCWISGVCCKKDQPGEFWHPTGCYDFEFRVEPNSMTFTVGSKIPINLYVKNVEEYTDRYNIDYWIESSNPSLISVDISGVTPTDNIAPQQIKLLNPRILILSKSATGKVWFNVTSWGEPSLQKNASLTILSSDLPISLVEFDYFGFFILIILVFVVYFFFKLR